MHVAIRVDGGSEIGYGHIVRSSALASELRSRNHDVTYATTTPNHVRENCPDGSGIVELPSRDDPEQFVEWIETATPDLVFTDAYPVDTAYQRVVRDRVPLAVLQDDARHTICADVFINGNLYAETLDYTFINPSPRMCLGTDHVLLRDEIRELTVERAPWRDPPERALVTMGGSDLTNLTPTVVQAFDGFDVSVDAVVGPGFSRRQERAVREAASDITANVEVLRDPDDLPERMRQADFAVCTSSTTTYELLALETPIISCPVVENQEPIAEALREHKVATVVQSTNSTNAFREAINEYITNTTVRRERKERGRTLVDARGTERVCAEILSLGEQN